MAEKRQLLARRYAQAILNYYQPSYTDIQDCYTIGNYCERHPTTAFFLRLSSISAEDKVAVMVRVIHDIFEPRDSVMTLIKHILKRLRCDGRLPLLMKICDMLYHEYHQRHNIEACTVYTSHDVDHDTLRSMMAWLEQQLGKTLKIEYQIDPDLIAGIRVRGQTFIWEDSIAKALRRMQHNAHAQWGIS